MITEKQFNTLCDYIEQSCEGLTTTHFRDHTKRLGSEQSDFILHSSSSTIADAIVKAYQPVATNWRSGNFGMTNAIMFKVTDIDENSPLFTPEGRKKAHDEIFDHVATSVKNESGRLKGTLESVAEETDKTQDDLRQFIESEIEKLKKQFDEATGYAEKNEKIQELSVFYKTIRDHNSFKEIVTSKALFQAKPSSEPTTDEFSKKSARATNSFYKEKTATGQVAFWKAFARGMILHSFGYNNWLVAYGRGNAVGDAFSRFVKDISKGELVNFLKQKTDRKQKDDNKNDTEELRACAAHLLNTCVAAKLINRKSIKEFETYLMKALDQPEFKDIRAHLTLDTLNTMVMCGLYDIAEKSSLLNEEVTQLVQCFENPEEEDNKEKINTMAEHINTMMKSNPQLADAMLKEIDPKLKSIKTLFLPALDDNLLEEIPFTHIAHILMIPFAYAITGVVLTLIGLVNTLANIIPALMQDKNSQLMQSAAFMTLGVCTIALAAIAPLGQAVNAASRLYATAFMKPASNEGCIVDGMSVLSQALGASNTTGIKELDRLSTQIAINRIEPEDVKTLLTNIRDKIKNSSASNPEALIKKEIHEFIVNRWEKPPTDPTYSQQI